MDIVQNLATLSPLPPSCGLSIGSFDGVHLGHQALLKQLRQSASGPLVILTFSNHPSHVIAHRPPIPLLTTTEHKLKLLAENGVDVTLLLAFDTAFANQSFDAFLTTLQEKVPFSHLLLGKGATFGKNKRGDEIHVRALAETLHFHVDYLPKVEIQGSPVSSGKIRDLIQQGLFAQAKALLGRPYSLFLPLRQEQNAYVASTTQLCLPPDGAYPIELLLPQKKIRARARIQRAKGIIEIHLTDSTIPIPTHSIEIFFSSS